MTAPPAGALEACLALLEKATPGEWTNNLHDDAHMGRLYGGRQGDGTHPVLCKTWNSPSDEGLHCYVGISQLQGMHNSAAIAAAVNLLRTHGPALLAALRLREVLGWRFEQRKNGIVMIAPDGSSVLATPDNDSIAGVCLWALVSDLARVLEESATGDEAASA